MVRPVEVLSVDILVADYEFDGWGDKISLSSKMKNNTAAILKLRW